MSIRNPLISDGAPDETLSNASNVLTYLPMVEPMAGCELMADGPKYGLWLIQPCVTCALKYEEGRVKTLREANTQASDA